MTTNIEKAKLKVEQLQERHEAYIADLNDIYKYIRLPANDSESQRLRIAELEKQLTDATSCNDNCTAKVKELKAEVVEWMEAAEYNGVKLDESQNKVKELEALRLSDANTIALLSKYSDKKDFSIEKLESEIERLTQHTKNVAA